MRKNIVKAIVIFVIFYTSLLLLGGCVPPKEAVVPQAEIVDPSDGTFTVVFPSEMKEAPAELMKKVQNIGYYHSQERNRGFSRDYQGHDVEAIKWSFENDSFTVERYIAFATNDSTIFSNKREWKEFKQAFISYLGTIERLSVTSLKFIPRTVKKMQKYKHIEAQLAPNEIVKLFTNATFRTVFEIDSEFNSDATYANFARLTRKEAFREGYKDPVTGKIYTERFWLKVNNLEIPVTVATYPYRNGSKVVINADVPAQRNGSIFDFSIPAKAIQLELERIVKS